MMTIAMMACALMTYAQQAMDQFVDNLMAKMTLQEKIGQLNLLPGGDITTGKAMNSPLGEQIAKGELGAILNIKGADKIRELQEIAVKKSRLGIPILFGLDVIHGYRTVLPIPLAQSCSWDLQALEQGARMAAVEASADGIGWTYSPMVDVSLDARWGRIAESNGEDPYLSSLMGAALVRGYQGDFSSNTNIMACLKHYALYGASEAGRDYNTVDMSRVRMFNQYLPPYKAAVEAGVGSVMSSFNLIDGIPATGNRYLMTEVLRNQWKFNGFLVTDYGSINEMTQHGVALPKEATALALNAGTDMDMCSEAFSKFLEENLRAGKVTEADINTACRRVLEAKYVLGLFKDPYKFCDKKRAKKALYTPEHRQLARNIAVETFVLLKNEGNILPLKKNATIALIGPLANDSSNICGSWSTADDPSLYTPIRRSMEKAIAGSGKVLYAQGCNVYNDAQRQRGIEFGRPVKRGDAAQLKAEALQVAAQADVVVACLGELAGMSGESHSRTDLTLPDAQMELLRALVATGKPVVLLNFAGRPTVLSWESEHVGAIMNVWHGGSEMGDALCDVLFGSKVPSGKLTVSMPRATGQEPLYYNHHNTGRPIPDGTRDFHVYQSNYIDVTAGPLYPFGYGLSYTTFKYSDLRLSANHMGKDGSVTASVAVTNTGDYDADEVVQLYIHDLFASIARPVQELKDFQRIHLQKGETKTVTFEVTADKLKFYNSQLDYVIEPGDFDIMVGPDSKNVQTVRLTVD